MHADPEVCESQGVRTKRTPVVPSRARRDVDDLDLGDQVGGAVRRQRHLVDSDDLAVAILDSDDNGLLVSHDGSPLSSSRRLPPALRLEGKATYDFSYITRDEVSIAKEV
mgnify:CR=1 FL=1